MEESMKRGGGLVVFFLVCAVIIAAGVYFVYHPEILNKSQLGKLSTGPKEVSLIYNFEQESYVLKYTFYQGLNDYLNTLPQEIISSKGRPDEIDFILRDINNNEQKKFLLEFVDLIKRMRTDDESRARIAISIVQNIPFDDRTKINKAKYPYEVFFTNKGVCGEKSNLLIFILRELGYGTAYLRFNEEQHAAVGIKCPSQFAYKNTGYCFIETTGPSIITYSSADYYEFGKLHSDPQVFVISDGKSFDSVSADYSDMQRFASLNDKSSKLTSTEFSEWTALREKYSLEAKSCASGQNLCNGVCINPCGANKIFECSTDGPVCRLDPNNCPPGTNLCNSDCYPQCGEGTFECREEGGTCIVYN